MRICSVKRCFVNVLFLPPWLPRRMRDIVFGERKRTDDGTALLSRIVTNICIIQTYATYHTRLLCLRDREIIRLLEFPPINSHFSCLRVIMTTANDTFLNFVCSSRPLKCMKIENTVANTEKSLRKWNTNPNNQHSLLITPSNTT